MKRKRIVIIGAGGMAREVVSTLRWINRVEPAFDFLGYVVSDLSQLGVRDSSEQVIGDRGLPMAGAEPGLRRCPRAWRGIACDSIEACC